MPLASPLPSPKRAPRDTDGLADLLPYYAGYNLAWATRMLNEVENRDAMVLDPWNGSGTTTVAAGRSGMRSVGVDLSPMTLVVAHARTLRAHARAVDVGIEDFGNGPDPLLDWFQPAAADQLRSIAAIEGAEGFDIVRLMAGLLTVREFTRPFVGSNPTWVRKPDSADRIPASNELSATASRTEEALRERLSAEPPLLKTPELRLGDARSLPLDDDSVGTVLGSPPYLTRIDYTVAYGPELALLGLNAEKRRLLRDRMMGTTLIRSGEALDMSARFGRTARKLVDQVRQHPTKDAAGYYLKQKLQYLSDLDQTLREITRVTISRSEMTVVVQNSYFKDVPIDLASIYAEEAARHGWELVGIDMEPVPKSLVTLNAKARAYPKTPVAEAVIHMRLS